MKYLKTFEAKQTIQDIEYKIKDFLKKFNEDIRMSEDIYIDNLNYFGLPEELEYEHNILYYMYRDPHDWKEGFKVTDKYIQRQVKIYVQKLLYKKFNEDPNTFFKLKEKFDNPRWLGNHQRESTMKYVMFNFQTALKHAPEYLNTSSKYNM